MRDLIKVRVVEARKDKSAVSARSILTLKLEPYEPLVLLDEEVGYLFVSVTDEDGCTSGAWRQARLR